VDLVVDEVIASLAVELQAIGARVDVGQLPPLRADGARLFRIIENLVQNAIRYRNPDAETRVEVSGDVIGDSSVISVRDWGMGIAPEDRERVFGVGVRLVAEARDDESSHGSRGLGLATVRRLVSELGGDVWIDPHVRHGTCVRVALPRS
jgi:signal transduction histidine kinase